MSATEEEKEKQALLDLQTNVAGWLDTPRMGEAPQDDHNRVFQLLKAHPCLAKRVIRQTRHGPTYMVETYPLNYLLAAKAPLEMVQEVYRMHPDALKMKDSRGDLPLHYSTRHCCGLQVVEFLLAEFPRAAAERPPLVGKYPVQTLMESIRHRPNFNEEQVTKVVQMLYNAHPPSWWDKVEGYQLYRLNWSFSLSRLMLSANTPSSLLVWLAEQENNYDEGCCIMFDEDDYLDEEPALIPNLNHFVPSLDCKGLTLIGGDYMNHIYVGGEFLGQLFAQVKIPPSLSLCVERFKVHVPDPVRWDNRVQKWDSSQLRGLTLSNLSMTADCFQRFLASLRFLPRLAELRIYDKHGFTRTPCTAVIISLFETSPNLQSFSLFGPTLEVDTQQLCQALQTSNSPAFFRYERVNYEDLTIHADQEIAYYSALNHCGCTKLSATEASKEVLVECLSSLFHMQGANDIPNLKQSVLYGLLRQAPGLWAFVPSETLSIGKKRPALEPMEPHEEEKTKKKHRVKN